MIATKHKQEEHKTCSEQQAELLKRRTVLNMLPLYAMKNIEQAMIDYPAGYVNILSDGSVYFSSRGLMYTGSAIAYEGDFHC
jgi:hypothetical protein